MPVQPVYTRVPAKKLRTPELDDAESQQYSPYPRFSRCAALLTFLSAGLQAARAPLIALSLLTSHQSTGQFLGTSKGLSLMSCNAPAALSCQLGSLMALRPSEHQLNMYCLGCVGECKLCKVGRRPDEQGQL